MIINEIIFFSSKISPISIILFMIKYSSMDIINIFKSQISLSRIDMESLFISSSTIG